MGLAQLTSSHAGPASHGSSVQAEPSPQFPEMWCNWKWSGAAPATGKGKSWGRAPWAGNGQGTLTLLVTATQWEQIFPPQGHFPHYHSLPLAPSLARQAFQDQYRKRKQYKHGVSHSPCKMSSVLSPISDARGLARDAVYVIHAVLNTYFIHAQSRSC